ncbi:MAG: TIGR03086 family metal-binding protein [Actinomycetes bacterium]
MKGGLVAVPIKSIPFDSTDPYRLARFWSQLTGFIEDPDNTNAPEDPEALLLAPDGQLALLFIAVPEQKHVKNRLHLDMVPLDRRRDQEVDRLVGLGARVVDDQRRPDGTGWVVLSDPEGNEFCVERSDEERTALVEQLARTFAAVGDLVAKVRPEQWPAPTPCTDWTVRQLVDHLIGMNRVFAALLAGEPPPRRAADHIEIEDDPVGAYRDSAARLQSAFEQPGVLERAYRGPLGAATGAQRLQIRLYDLLAHGWDLAQAMGQPAELPDDVAEQALAFVRIQLTEQARPGRFGPAQRVADHVPAIERLVAFLGRPVDADP